MAPTRLNRISTAIGEWTSEMRPVCLLRRFQGVTCRPVVAGDAAFRIRRPAARSYHANHMGLEH